MCLKCEDSIEDVNGQLFCKNPNVVIGKNNEVVMCPKVQKD